MYPVHDFMSPETLPASVNATPNRGEGETPAPKLPAIVRISEYLLLSVVIAGCADTLRFFAFYFRVPFSLNFEEGNVLNAALRITHGLNPYPPVRGFPCVVNPYGPVFYYALAPLVKLFGANFAAPRALALASALAVAIFLVLLLRLWTGSTVVAFGFGLSFLAVSLVRDWVYVLRVDLFGLVLSMAGIYVFATTRRLAPSALLFLAALYSKITLLAVPVACFLFLLAGGEGDGDRERPARQAWQLAAWMLGLGSAGLLALGLATRGWGLFDMFFTHPDPYSFAQYARIVRPFALLDAALLAGAVALAVRDIRHRALSLPLIYLVLASVMTLTAGKFGSDANHLLEWQAALCLAAGCGYASLRRQSRVDPVAALIPLGLAALVVLGLSEKPRLNPLLADCAPAYQLAARQPGELLTENPGAAALSGKTVWLSNSFEYAFLGKAGRLDQRPLTQLVQRRFFSIILLGNALPELEQAAKQPLAPGTIWPPAFVSALEQNYHQVASFACVDAHAAFEPNPASGADSTLRTSTAGAPHPNGRDFGSPAAASHLTR